MTFVRMTFLRKASELFYNSGKTFVNNSPNNFSSHLKRSQVFTLVVDLCIRRKVIRPIRHSMNRQSVNFCSTHLVLRVDDRHRFRTFDIFRLHLYQPKFLNRRNNFWQGWTKNERCWSIVQPLIADDRSASSHGISFFDSTFDQIYNLTSKQVHIKSILISTLDQSQRDVRTRKQTQSLKAPLRCLIYPAQLIIVLRVEAPEIEPSD